MAVTLTKTRMFPGLLYKQDFTAFDYKDKIDNIFNISGIQCILIMFTPNSPSKSSKIHLHLPLVNFMSLKQEPIDSNLYFPHAPRLTYLGPHIPLKIYYPSPRSH